ncbi:hypothetical protein GCM10009123_11510 [Kangiella japonica]|uniref:Beta-lactamase n=1 Tax=Kangiella japonica TaxID=647384 RepID=A0ABN0SXV5_9GAMM
MLAVFATEGAEGLDCHNSYILSESKESLNCAVAYYEKKVENHNNNDDRLTLGSLYFLSNQKDKAIELYEQVRGDEKSGDASYNLAQVYYSESKGNKDLNKVKMYLKEAADAGIAQAQLELSYMYSTYLMNKDFSKAVKYLTDAAENNEKYGDGYVSETVIKAQFILGKIYLDGMWGVEKNKNKASYWIELSSKNQANKDYGVK